MKEFSCSTKVIADTAAQEVIGRFHFQRLMIVSDPFFAQNGSAEALGKQVQVYEIFDKVQPDPSVALAAEGTARIQQFRPDAVVALGGGSAIDCAKAMIYFSGEEIPLIAVPTTSGSGSEVTDFAILTHDGVKHPLVDPKLRPKIAILDEHLVSSLPPALVADGGFDVLAHALEAWVAQNSNPFTDALALDAFRTAYSLLPQSYAGQKTARLPVHIASCMAGVAFTQAGLGVCHAIAHALGGAFHVPHGRLNAILLPGVLSCNENTARYAELARRIGLGGLSDTIALRNLKNGLIHLRAQLNLPSTLAQAGVKPQAVYAQKDELIAAALADPCCSTNPVPVTQQLVWKILQEAAGRG